MQRRSACIVKRCSEEESIATSLFATFCRLVKLIEMFPQLSSEVVLSGTQYVHLILGVRVSPRTPDPTRDIGTPRPTVYNMEEIKNV